ncbi:Uncharacterized protein EJ110_NYTH29808 [Nymphaea thermarum]|nr:Uncharacterized protein EJ110_NYTH29808 [Nymphaea thermarum]
MFIVVLVNKNHLIIEDNVDEKISTFKSYLSKPSEIPMEQRLSLSPSDGDLMYLKQSLCSDADWGSCKYIRHSITGYCIFLGNVLVSLKIKKQNTVAHFSAEAKYQSCMSIPSTWKLTAVWLGILLGQEQ